MATLTTANSSILLAVRGLFPVPQKMQGYAADDSFSTDDVQPVETQMGVDGILSAGFTPYPTQFTITLQADSPSIVLFDTVLEAQKANKEVSTFDGIAIVQGNSNKYIMTKGFLTSATPMDNGKKILQPRKFTITFENVTKAPF